MTDSIFVSVVIPAYNYAHYLGFTIESVLAQTYSHFELIVVDDGSKDNTAEVVASFLARDARVRYEPKTNGGLSSARNHGIRVAKHDYVGFVDADDMWEPTLIEEAMAAYRVLSADYTAVATAMARMESDGSMPTGKIFTFGRTGEMTPYTFGIRNGPFVNSVIVRKAVFSKIGYYDETLRASEDRDIWLRMTGSGNRFWFIDKPLARSRRHGKNMSGQATRMEKNSRRVLIASWKRGDVPRWRIDFWLRAFSVNVYLASWMYAESGRYGTAFSHLLLSVALWPFFLRPQRFGEGFLFRVRAAKTFLLDAVFGKAGGHTVIEKDATA